MVWQLTTRIIAGLITLPVLAATLQMFWPTKKKSYKGQHVIVSGGSQGMGKSIAKEFIKRGANVSIVARTQRTLDEALEELKTCVILADQSVRALSVDCADASAVAKGIAELGTPDVFFCCAAGGTHPGFFVELSPEEHVAQMSLNYNSSVYCAHSAIRAMLKDPPAPGVQRKIIFTSSVAAFVNISGYSTYMASKAAVRGLADTLRQEFLMYDVGVHCIFPATIFSPGFAVEQTIKPELTKILEGADEGQTCDEVAEASMRGLDKGHAMINTEFQGNLLRCAMKGPSPKNGLLDFLYSLVASIALPFVLFDWEQKVKRYGTQHKEDLAKKGLMKRV
ncbi:hypothetical protein BCR37DRAFT_352911 [Protomyces lactucae-debilis]|uniref:3-dehydrosphinganine reductase n=1 Tax=Protomyces lactucae-debilis TaxID=2754530 RepID=A0A1Y2EQQ9_PROLT|nr:uncharacterized protein BCR37DRAFT_352911 [Protomyces lactucae-debilis]ORY73920.1 hypothetical protein BCR37DRAFT_352911 [Protomyces lactucae-debilis]